MKICITKGRSNDVITITRDDGSAILTRFPHKGPVPHDAVHFFVERGLGFTNAFWGTVLRGILPEDIAAMAKAAGHVSTVRAAPPDPSIIELVQAERLVECFEADLWGGGGSDDDLLAMAAAGCATSHVPLPTIAPDVIPRVRDEIREFARRWRATAFGGEAIFDWSATPLEQPSRPV